MASITLPGVSRRERTSERDCVPVKFTRSGTPYVESAVAVMPPQALRLLIQKRLAAKQDPSD